MRVELQTQKFAYEDLINIAPAYDACFYCLSPETAYLAVVLLERFPDWRSRWFHNDGTPITNSEWDYIRAAVARGVYELMGCNELAAGLMAIADALKTRSTGASGCFPAAPIADCLPNIPNDQWQPPTIPSPSNPATDPPPEGFDTWEEYYVYKCQAARYIWQWLVNLCYALGGLSGLQLTSAIVVPIVAALAGTLPAVFTPVGFVAFVGGVVAIGILSIIGIGAAIGMGNWLNENRDEIICALYSSGSAAEALTAIAGFIEDAIEAGIAAAGLGEVTGPLVAAGLGEIFSLVQNTGLIAPLFQIVLDLNMPEADCSDCDQPSELLVRTSFVSPFNVLLVGASQFAENSTEEYYIDSNYWLFTPTENIDNLSIAYQYSAPSATACQAKVVRNSDLAGFYVGVVHNATADWQQASDTGVTSQLVAGTTYRLIIDVEFGKTGHFRSIELRAA